MTDIEKMVDDVLLLSEEAKTEAARRDAEKQIRAVKEAIRDELWHIGGMLSRLNKAKVGASR